MTFVSYPDIFSESDNGEFRIEVVGSQGKNDFFRDQSGFVYRLISKCSGEELWSWRPEEKQGLADYPHDAWVNDLGWVVVRLHEWFHAGILVLSPQGRFVMLRPIQSFLETDEPGILQDETDSHIGGTSAGPSWEASSINAFHSFEGKPFWSILTWWGRRIVIELDSGNVVDEVEASQRKLISKVERDWILTNLSHAARLESEQELRNRWSELFYDCYTAAYHAGCFKVAEAEASLRILETSSYSGGSGPSDWFGHQSLPLRMIAKMSLLKNGFEPRWYANMIIADSESNERCEYPEPAIDRNEETFQIGMSQPQLLKEIGVPEFLRNTWDYSLGTAESPSTVRIHWHDQHKLVYDHTKPFPSERFKEYRQKVREEPPVIGRVEKVELPVWNVDSAREYTLAHGH